MLAPRRKPRIPTRSRRAFTYVEVVISAGILVTVMGMFVAALEGGFDSFTTSCARGVLTARADGAFSRLEADLKEAPAGMVHIKTSGDGLSSDLCAIALPSARDSGGTFHVTADYQPDWRAVVIYCPYATDKGVAQLRRYVYYDDARAFAFPFTIAQVTADEIRLEDAASGQLVMSRPDGNTLLAAGREFEVLCPGVTGLEVSAGAPSRLTLRAGYTVRKNARLNTEVTRDVAHRN